MKLSEQFLKEARFAEEQSRKAFEEKNDVLANHMAGGASAFRHVATEVEKLESDNAALTKRVAELEDALSKERDAAIGLRNRVSELEDEAVLDVQLIDDQRAIIADLESQLEAKDKRVAELAWTPVSAGLKTGDRWVDEEDNEWWILDDDQPGVYPVYAVCAVATPLNRYGFTLGSTATFSADGTFDLSEEDGAETVHLLRLTRRVYLVPTDPAEVVAELRVMEGHARKNLLAGHTGCEVDGWEGAADLVAEKLGVES